MIEKIKKYFEKTSKSINWETRYKNLEKKYELALKDIERLEKKLDKDNNLLIIKEKNNYIKTLQEQRDNLREELLKK